MAEAAHVVSWMMNRYCPCSRRTIVSSVAVMFVVMATTRESPLGEAHRVAHPREAALWLLRTSPGV